MESNPTDVETKNIYKNTNVFNVAISRVYESISTIW